MNTILEIKNIEAKYGNIIALKDISIDVKEGEIVSLIGANGAGKSTLLKSIVGLVSITNGQIKYKNELILEGTGEKSGGIFNFNKNLRIDNIVAKGISLVPEGREVFAGMTVLENLEMGAFLKTDKKYIQDKVEEMFNLFPILKDRQKQKAGSLSGGEQQMLSISRALMSSPDLLLLDEPGLGLAPILIGEIFETITKINKENNVTIFLVEQNAKMALNISDRGFVMETGNITLEDESKNLLNNPKVKSAYLGE